MITDIITSLNWLDIVVLIIVVRTTYIGFVRGLSVEIFKFFGILLSCLISIHYYIKVVDFITRFISFDKTILGVISFFALWIVCMLLFSSLLNLFSKFIRIQSVGLLDRWGGFLFGALRGLFISGLLVMCLHLSNISYFKNSIDNSASAEKLTNLTFHTYRKIWSGIVIKFFPEEEVNYSILDKGKKKR